jgi:hypothetical protein
VASTSSIRGTGCCWTGHLKHLTGVPHVLGLLTTVFLAETGTPPPGKIWNQAYTEEQRAAVAALPASSAATMNRILAGNVDERGFVTNEHRYLAVAHKPGRAIEARIV